MLVEQWPLGSPFRIGKEKTFDRMKTGFEVSILGILGDCEAL